MNGHPARSVHRALMSLVALACVALLAATFAGRAQARTVTAGAYVSSTSSKPKPPVTSGSNYLALGDSVTFGYEEPNSVPTPDYTNASNFTGFPEVIASDLGVTDANAACPGETSSSFIDDTAQSNGCETEPGGSPGYRAAYPLHVSYPGSQLKYASKYLETTPDVTLVSLMIGANDYFLCEATTTDGCQSPIEQAGVIGTVEKNVKKIVTALREKAHYNGQLVLVDYYATSSALAASTDELDHFINEGGRGFHVQIANAFNSFAKASVHSGDSACTAGLLTQLSTGGCGVHPSVAGQTLLASTVMRAVRLG